MGMFAVKNDKGEWLSFDPSHESLWHTNNPTFFNDKSYAEAQNTGLDGSHVVELTEKPAPVVVSQEEADMLEKTKHNPTLRPSFMITEYSNSHKGNILGNDLEDRLMSAYVNGWTVEKLKLWNVKVPYTKGVWYYKASSAELLTICPANKELRGKFTAAEIDQYGLQDCEKEEVTDDGE